MKKLLIILLVGVFIAGCSNNDPVEDTTKSGNGQSVENTDKADKQIDDDNDVVNDTEVYVEAEKNPNYFIESHVFNQEVRFYTAFSINRDEDEEQTFSPEDRLELSLLSSDPSEQDILKSYTDLSLEQPDLSIHFNEEGYKLSTSSAQSILFFDSLVGISDFYGVEEIIFLNPEGEKNITVAERFVDNSIVVKEERGFTRGYYTIYDKELEKTFFLPGGELEEQVVNDNDEPLSFSETIEAMGTIVNEDAFYASAIVEGIQIVDASITDGVASVQYTIDEDKVTESDRIVFENAIQFAALDFHAREVELINDTLKESNTYPLISQ